MSDSVPQRIGDAERDRAAEYLREHMSVGRLSQDEFDDRITAALQARTSADLEPLFSDLPAPKPGQDVAVADGTPWPTYQPVAQVPPSSTVAMPDSKVANALAAASGVAWFLFVLSWAMGWGVWWLVFVPIALSSAAGKQRQELHRRERLWQQQNPQLPPGSSGPPSA